MDNRNEGECMEEVKERKVLVGCSISPKRDYLIPLLVRGIRSLSYSNKEILLLENSPDSKFFNIINNLDSIKIEKPEFIENDDEAIIRGREILRKRTLDGDFDYLFSLGLGVVPPQNAIEKLMKNEKEICSGVFCSLTMRKSGSDEGLDVIHRIPMPSLARFVEKGEKDIEVRNYKFPEVFPSKLMQVDLTSLNCALIHRNVLEKIDFEYRDKAPEDLLFALKCRDAKVKMYADSSVVFGYWERPAVGFYNYRR